LTLTLTWSSTATTLPIGRNRSRLSFDADELVAVAGQLNVNVFRDITSLGSCRSVCSP